MFNYEGFSPVFSIHKEQRVMYSLTVYQTFYQM